jgi:SPP1 family predicted phage head-tail adaptor
VTAAVRLLRRLVLEAPQRTPDGTGGFATGWVPVGTLWADVTARTAREELIAGAERPRVRYRIVVRGAPLGTAQRPAPEQRLREGGRVFSILTVAERDVEGRYLEILAEEGVLS